MGEAPDLIEFGNFSRTQVPDDGQIVPDPVAQLETESGAQLDSARDVVRGADRLNSWSGNFSRFNRGSDRTAHKSADGFEA